MLCKVLLLVLFSLAQTRSWPHGRPEILVENLQGSMPQVMPWPLPWYMQGIMLDIRPDDMQEKSEDNSETMLEESETLNDENQKEKLAKFVSVQRSPEIIKSTRNLKRGKNNGLKDSRIRILKNGEY